MRSKEEVFAERLRTLKSKLSPRQNLLIVSKTRPEEDIKLYYDLGHRDFGENRVQELLEKAQNLEVLCPEIRWHMIGHLQTNKVNQLFSVPKLFAIHSVDDLSLAEKLLKAEQRLGHEVQLYLQYNTSKEEEKSGFENYEDLKKAADLIRYQNSHLKLVGLMTMGTLRTENFENEARRCFQELNQIKKKLEFDTKIPLLTSMGMSQDYEIALSEESHWIRLGTMMFTL